jgi:hypothetical protein
MHLPGIMLASRRRVAVWFHEARTIRYVEVESGWNYPGFLFSFVYGVQQRRLSHDERNAEGPCEAPKCSQPHGNRCLNAMELSVVTADTSELRLAFGGKLLTIELRRDLSDALAGVKSWSDKSLTATS